MIQAPAVPVDRFAAIWRGRRLVAYGTDDELMLALTLMSGRGHDISDIVYLVLRTPTTCGGPETASAVSGGTSMTNSPPAPIEVPAEGSGLRPADRTVST